MLENLVTLAHFIGVPPRVTFKVSKSGNKFSGPSIYKVDHTSSNDVI
jgi:hypothetical protein